VVELGLAELIVEALKKMVAEEEVCQPPPLPPVENEKTEIVYFSLQDSPPPKPKMHSWTERSGVKRAQKASPSTSKRPTIRYGENEKPLEAPVDSGSNRSKLQSF